MFRRADQMQSKQAADADRRLGLSTKSQSSVTSTGPSTRFFRRTDTPVSEIVVPNTPPVVATVRRRVVDATTKIVTAKPSAKVSEPATVPEQPLQTVQREPEAKAIEPKVIVTPVPIVEPPAPPVVTPSEVALTALAEHFRGQPKSASTVMTPKPARVEAERKFPTPAPPPRPRGNDSRNRSWSFGASRRSVLSFDEQYGSRLEALKARAEALHPQAADLTPPAPRLGLTDLLYPKTEQTKWWLSKEEQKPTESAHNALIRTLNEGVKDLATLMALEKHMKALETTSERIKRNPARYVTKTSEAATAK